MKFRTATLDDLPVLLEFEQQVIQAERPFDSSIKPEDAKYYDISDLILNDQSTVIVAENEAGVMSSGYAQIRRSKSAFKHDSHAYLGFMYVSPHSRGQGVIQQLTEHLKTWIQDQSVSVIYLDVYSGNQSAIKAYEKMGFKPSLLEMKLELDKEGLI